LTGWTIDIDIIVAVVIVDVELAWFVSSLQSIQVKLGMCLNLYTSEVCVCVWENSFLNSSVNVCTVLLPNQTTPHEIYVSPSAL
jgi:hypothetical protein